MPATRSTIAAALKDVFLGTAVELLNNDSLIEAQIPYGNENVSGSKAIFSVHTGRNSGVSAITDGGNLPAAGNQKFGKGQVALSTLVGRIELTGKTIRTVNAGSGAYVSEPADEMDRLVTDLNRDKNRIWFGTGDGVIAATGVTTTSTTVNLAAATGLNALGQLAEGMVIDIGTVANPTAVASSREVLSVDEAAKTITISGAAVSTAATDRIFRAGAGGMQVDGGSGLTYGKEPNGLGNLISGTGALHELAESYLWRSHVEDLATATLDSDRIMKAAHTVYRRSGKSPNLLITDDREYRSFGASLAASKQTVNTVDLKGGFSALSVAVGGTGRDVKLTWDRDAPPRTGSFIDTEGESFKMHTTGRDWEWADEGDGVLTKVSGRDAFEAYMVKEVQFANHARNRSAKFINIGPA